VATGGHPTVADDAEQTVRVAVLGLGVNVLLAGAKLIAGLLGHSYALVADAVESMSDIAGSVIIWSGLRFGAKPPDENHPYGHGRAEALAALAVALIVGAAGVGIAVQAIREIVTPHRAPAPFTLIVLLLVVAVKETMFRVARRVGRRQHSDAVIVDAWHHRSDAITSGAAFIGITVALIGGPGYEPADDWAALFASAVILYNASRLARLPLRDLMDTQVEEVTEEARRIAEGVEGVLAIEKVHARRVGPNACVDMHVEVDPTLTVEDAHEIAHRVSDEVRAGVGVVSHVLVHIEPHRDGN
jgi:cation diffusion facilitator family transporter